MFLALTLDVKYLGTYFMVTKSGFRAAELPDSGTFRLAALLRWWSRCIGVSTTASHRTYIIRRLGL